LKCENKHIALELPIVDIESMGWIMLIADTASFLF